jgi:hypothetical protein
MKNGHINDWAPEVGGLINGLIAARCTIRQGNNGEDSFDFATRSRNKFIEELTACDEAWLYVTMPDEARCALYLVFGNSPGELVSDYTVHPLLDKVVECHSEFWDGKPQPTKPCPYAAARAEFNAEARRSAEENRVATWALLRLENGGNKVLCEMANTRKSEAVVYFRAFSRQPLDNSGYHKDGSISYCVAEGL